MHDIFFVKQGGHSIFKLACHFVGMPMLFMNKLSPADPKDERCIAFVAGGKVLDRSGPLIFLAQPS